MFNWNYGTPPIWMNFHTFIITYSTFHIGVDFYNNFFRGFPRLFLWAGVYFQTFNVILSLFTRCRCPHHFNCLSYIVHYCIFISNFSLIVSFLTWPGKVKLNRNIFFRSSFWLRKFILYVLFSLVSCYFTKIGCGSSTSYSHILCLLHFIILSKPTL